MSATPKGRDSRWYTVVVGVRLTDGLKGTIVQRPSSPALKQYRLPDPFSFSVVQRRFCAAWMANGCVSSRPAAISSGFFLLN